MKIQTGKLTPDDFMKSRRKSLQSGISPKVSRGTVPATAEASPTGPLSSMTTAETSTAVPSPDKSDRRITGSANIPLTAKGKEESEQLAESLSDKFDLVLTSPEKRAMQTAKEFGKPIALAGLDAWKRGSHEGKTVKAMEPAIKFLMLHPDKRPPGVSSISKEPGESLNEFAIPLLGTVQAIMATMDPDQRVLIVTHGGNLQTIDAWLKAGKPEDLSFDHKAMAKMPYWSVVGDLFIAGDNGLKKVKDNGDAGLYFCEHSSTEFNKG